MNIAKCDNEELVRLYQLGDKNALDELVLANTNLIHFIIKRYIPRSNRMGDRYIDPDDLLQEGYMGLMRAAEKYDFNKEHSCKFSTYAFQWINQKIHRYVIGGSDKDKANKEIIKVCTSLNKLVSEDDNRSSELIDFLDDSKAIEELSAVDDRMYYEVVRKEIDKAMEDNITLSEREILKLYYGFYGNEESMDNISYMLDMDLKKASNSKQRAINKLRTSKWGRAKYNEEYKEKVMSQSMKRTDQIIDMIDYANNYLYR